MLLKSKESVRPVGHKALLEASLVHSSVTLVTGDSASHSHPLVLYGVAGINCVPKWSLANKTQHEGKPDQRCKAVGLQSPGPQTMTKRRHSQQASKMKNLMGQQKRG